MNRALVAIPLLCIALAGCVPGDSISGSLPPVPADIQQCFRKSGVTVPNKALSVAEVESLWKMDRVRIVAMRTCGARFLSWYGSLRASWK